MKKGSTSNPQRCAVACAAVLAAALSFGPAPAGAQCAATSKGDLPRVLLQRGERFLAMGKLDAARANYARVIAVCNATAEGAEAHNDLGVVLARSGDEAAALAEYETAIAIDGYPLAYFNLGKALRDRFRRDGVDADRERAHDAFEVFAAYLREETALPSVVSFQRDELLEYVDAALRELAR
jgi:tetratricopeptide (TPR) repeat protein